MRIKNYKLYNIVYFKKILISSFYLKSYEFDKRLFQFEK